MKTLKELRKQKKISQQNIANYLCISQVAYSKYETGKSEPSQEILVKLSDFFNVSIDYLLNNDKTNQIYKSEIQSLFDVMTEHQKVRIIAYARGMLESDGVDVDDILKSCSH